MWPDQVRLSFRPDAYAEQLDPDERRRISVEQTAQGSKEGRQTTAEADTCGGSCQVCEDILGACKGKSCNEFVERFYRHPLSQQNKDSEHLAKPLQDLHGVRQLLLMLSPAIINKPGLCGVTLYNLRPRRHNTTHHVTENQCERYSLHTSQPPARVDQFGRALVVSCSAPRLSQVQARGISSEVVEQMTRLRT